MLMSTITNAAQNGHHSLISRLPIHKDVTRFQLKTINIIISRFHTNCEERTVPFGFNPAILSGRLTCLSQPLSKYLPPQTRANICARARVRSNCCASRQEATRVEGRCKLHPYFALVTVAGRSTSQNLKTRFLKQPAPLCIEGSLSKSNTANTTPPLLCSIQYPICQRVLDSKSRQGTFDI